MSHEERQLWSTFEHQAKIDSYLQSVLGGVSPNKVFRLQTVNPVGAPGHGGRPETIRRNKAMVLEVLRLVENGLSRAQAERDVAETYYVSLRTVQLATAQWGWPPKGREETQTDRDARRKVVLAWEINLRHAGKID
jgi:hypothetical protein